MINELIAAIEAFLAIPITAWVEVFKGAQQVSEGQGVRMY
jgi:hypothetical protein